MVSAAETVVGFAAAAASVAIEVVLVAEEEESVTKVGVASAEEVGMVVVAAALVTAQHLPLMHLLDLVEQAVEASAAAVIKAHQVDR